MIKITLNGEKIELEKDMSVQEFLNLQGFELKFIAVERDYEILPRSLWDKAMMSEGEKYEVVKFVGGG